MLFLLARLDRYNHELEEDSEEGGDVESIGSGGFGSFSSFSPRYHHRISASFSTDVSSNDITLPVSLFSERKKKYSFLSIFSYFFLRLKSTIHLIREIKVVVRLRAKVKTESAFPEEILDIVTNPNRPDRLWNLRPILQIRKAKIFQRMLLPFLLKQQQVPLPSPLHRLQRWHLSKPQQQQ